MDPQKVLCFPRNLVAFELHDADGVRRQKLFRLLLRVFVSRIVFRAEVFQSKRPHRGYLRDVLAGFRPVEMGRIAGENDHDARRIGFQSAFSNKLVLKTSCPSW